MQPVIIVPQQNVCVKDRRTPDTGHRGCRRYALGLCDCPAECELIAHPEHFQQVEAKPETRVAA